MQKSYTYSKNEANMILSGGMKIRVQTVIGFEQKMVRVKEKTEQFRNVEFDPHMNYTTGGRPVTFEQLDKYRFIDHVWRTAPQLRTPGMKQYIPFILPYTISKTENRK